MNQNKTLKTFQIISATPTNSSCSLLSAKYTFCQQQSNLPTAGIKGENQCGGRCVTVGGVNDV